ncbi:MAG: DNA polymerase III subunit alpha [Planctomycetes bacterium]|nr:DNA polymerase III subunit alpha [Planctomycetota bacterium]
MSQVSATAWNPGRPNQQLVDKQRADAASAPQERREREALLALGIRLRAAFAGVPLPLIAVQTHYSLLEGTASPQAWSTVLGAWLGDAAAAARDRRGGNFPAGASAVTRAAAALITLPANATNNMSAPQVPTNVCSSLSDSKPPWAVLADRDDLLALPTVIERWGRRLVVGSVVRLDDVDAVLLAPTAAAYRALCRLLTARHAGTSDTALLAGLPSDEVAALIVLVRSEITGHRFAEAGARVWWRADIRPAPGDTPFPAVAMPLLTHIDEDRAAARVLAAMRRRGTIDTQDAKDAAGTALADLLRMPEAYRGYEDQLARSAELRAQTWYVPETNTTGDDLHLPPLPPALRNLDPDTELRRLAEAGIPRRYPHGETPELRTRLEHELRVIRDKGFASYLLTVWSIAHKRRTCGRGSAASSLVVYLLGITNVDPITANLLFERFLSPERIDPPDVDVDFAWNERDAVFSEILKDFGSDHVGMVATHLHLHGDGALREAARAHGLGDHAITAMGQRLTDLQRYGVDRHGLRGDALPEPWPHIIAAADHLAGAPRHLGVHCGGVVITARPLATIVPVHPAAKRIPDPDEPALLRHIPTIAWEKDGAEDLRLVKIDVLGNRSLAVIQDSIADLQEWGVWDARFDDEEVWSAHTQNDTATKELLRTGRTVGCFYIESPAMRQLQAKVDDGSFDRLVVHSSIIRPAGMDFITTYINRHHYLRDHPDTQEHKQQRVHAERWYPHPILTNLLSESYGVLSYQEDVMVVAQRMAGFTSAGANKLRKALGRNDTAERLQELVEDFRSGCRANGIDDETIRLVWRMISSFAGYSFAKAHSASYAVVSFHCAWLKAHHPAVFLARVIANEGGFYGTSAYVEEARRLGIAILPPCVVHGHWATRAADARTIRLGLQRVKGLGRTCADHLVRERGVTPFTGVCDLLERTACDREQTQALSDAGAFDVLLATNTPEQRAWITATAVRCATTNRKTAVGHHQRPAPSARPATSIQAITATQATLDFGRAPPRDPVPPMLPASDPHARAWRRWRTLGVLPDAHPLALWHIRHRPSLRARDLTPERAKERVHLVAIAITRKDVNAIATDKNTGHTTYQDMAFVTLEDETGLIESVWFPEVYRRHAVLLERSEPLLITGTITVDFAVVTLAVQSCAVCAVSRG